jgi:cysteine desulfurase
MKLEHYMDVNGSTPVHPEVAAAVQEVMLTLPGNPSAGHPEGLRAREAIEQARVSIALGVGARPEEIFFTSGGTESNNWALSSAWKREEGEHAVVSAIEHKSVLEPLRAASRIELTELAPAADGALRVAQVEGALRANTRLVSVMLANNETGVLQPVAEIAVLCRSRGIAFHTDAVTALGKVPIDVRQLGCDSLSLSAHKMYAPKGVGVLYVRTGSAIGPWMLGCGQQGGLRSGTENTSGVVGFGHAMELMRAGHLGDARSLAALRDELWERLSELHSACLRNGSGPCLPGTLNVAFPGHSAHALQTALAQAGYSVGTGASGSSGRPSHVLSAMGLDAERARSSLRFSLGHFATSTAIEGLVETLRGILSRSRPTKTTGAPS